MKLFKKIIRSKSTIELEAIEQWVVTWISYNRNPSYSYNYPDRTKEFKAFVNKEDAQAFKEALEDAHKLLGSESLSKYIELYKQKR